MWDRAVASGHPHLVTVLGPAGIGKSRLAREVAEAVHSKGGRELSGRSLPYEEQSPYRAAAEMVRSAAGIFEAEPVADARGKLATLTGSLLPEPDVAEATRYLSLLLGLGLDEPPDEPIHLLFAARQLLEHLSEREPLLLVFEDLHWADDALLELIDYLVTHVRDHRVVFLALARPEFLERRPTWGAGMIGNTTLPLEALTPAETAEVVGALLGSADADAVERVVATAGGNPLFIEELVAALEDDPDADELPATVRTAIAARIDALSPTARATLLNASVIGATFWRNVVQGIGEVEDIAEALEALEDRGLVHRRAESQVEGDTEYAFKHILIRDTAYGTLPRAIGAASSTPLPRASSRASTSGSWSSPGSSRTTGARPASPARDRLPARGGDSRAGRARLGGDVRPVYPRVRMAETDEDRRRIRFGRPCAGQLEDYSRAGRELAELIPSSTAGTRSRLSLARGASTLLDRADRGDARDRRARRGARGPARAPRARGVRRSPCCRRATGCAAERVISNAPSSTVIVRSRRGSRGRGSPSSPSTTTCTPTPTTGSAGTSARSNSLGSPRRPAGSSPTAPSRPAGLGMTGLILAAMGRYEEALATAEEAIATARRLGRPDNVVRTTPRSRCARSSRWRRRSSAGGGRLRVSARRTSTCRG